MYVSGVNIITTMVTTVNTRRRRRTAWRYVKTATNDGASRRSDKTKKDIRGSARVETCVTSLRISNARSGTFSVIRTQQRIGRVFPGPLQRLTAEV